MVGNGPKNWKEKKVSHTHTRTVWITTIRPKCGEPFTGLLAQLEREGRAIENSKNCHLVLQIYTDPNEPDVSVIFCVRIPISNWSISASVVCDFARSLQSVNGRSLSHQNLENEFLALSSSRSQLVAVCAGEYPGGKS